AIYRLSSKPISTPPPVPNANAKATEKSPLSCNLRPRRYSSFQTSPSNLTPLAPPACTPPNLCARVSRSSIRHRIRSSARSTTCCQPERGHLHLYYPFGQLEGPSRPTILRAPARKSLCKTDFLGGPHETCRGGDSLLRVAAAFV